MKEKKVLIVNTNAENCENSELSCESENEEQASLTTKEKVKIAWDKSKPIIKKVCITAGIIAGLTLLFKMLSGQDEEEYDNYEGMENDIEDDAVCEENFSEVDEEPQTSPRYRVEYRAFKTGEWYTKTETDNIGGAYSVTSMHNTFGRASRLIDTYTGEILKETEEDPWMAACNGYPNGYN